MGCDPITFHNVNSNVFNGRNKSLKIMEFMYPQEMKGKWKDMALKVISNGMEQIISLSQSQINPL